MAFTMYSIGVQTCLLNSGQSSSFNNEYVQILTIDRMPVEDTPLKGMIKAISPRQLSPYKINGLSSDHVCSCTYALMSMQPDAFCRSTSASSSFMTQREIPNFISLLSQYGYQVDTTMSQLPQLSQLMQSEDGGRSLLFYVKYSSSQN